MKGLLTLIPTPLKENLTLEESALALLKEKCLEPNTLLLVEELKIARQRWLKWGLPREAIEKFIAFNEHTAEALEKEILPKLKNGQEAFLMSDGGLPAFCDPGQGLVDACHTAGIKVSSTAFANSISLAMALSGFSHQQFFFAGFLPQKDPERAAAMSGIWKNPHTQILMETPYRRQKLLDELLRTRPANQLKRRVFIAIELNGEKESLFRGDLETVIKNTQAIEKLEFVLVIDKQS